MRKVTRREVHRYLLRLASVGVSGRVFGPSFSFAGDDAPAIFNGQSINLTNAGRSGAALYGIPNYSADLRTLEGDQTCSTDPTIRNTKFPGIVKVTSGNVVFEFYSFVAQPPSALTAPGAALQQYNGGKACGTVTCNWCDFDSGLRETRSL
jgi:hypothetical protein